MADKNDQHVIEMTIYVVGANHQDSLKLRDDILIDLKRTYGIRKLGDMGLYVTLEYRKPEFEWSVPTALAQLRHGRWESERTNSALSFLEMDYLTRRDHY